MTRHDHQTEIDAFHRLRPALLQNAVGPWVVIADGDLQGRFLRFSDAARFALATLPDKRFLIRDLDAIETDMPLLTLELPE
jgi:hypothetical protein